MLRRGHGFGHQVLIKTNKTLDLKKTATDMVSLCHLFKAWPQTSPGGMRTTENPTQVQYLLYTFSFWYFFSSESIPCQHQVSFKTQIRIHLPCLAGNSVQNVFQKDIEHLLHPDKRDYGKRRLSPFDIATSNPLNHHNLNPQHSCDKHFLKCNYVFIVDTEDYEYDCAQMLSSEWDALK